jgi:hypothetical protein
MSQLLLDLACPPLPRPDTTAPRARRAGDAAAHDQLSLVIPPRCEGVAQLTDPAPCREPSAAAEEARAGAAPHPFGAWLAGRRKAAGAIGELAKALSGNAAIEKLRTADEVRRWFSSVGADGDAFDALDDAERAWLRSS